MKIIKYRICVKEEKENLDAKLVPQLYDKAIGYSSENLEIAKAEAHNGEITIEDDTTVMRGVNE